MSNSSAFSFISSGVRYMLLATIAFSIMFTIIKELDGFHVFQIVFFRSILPAMICISILKKNKVSLVGNNLPKLFLRAFLGLISMTLFFVTVQRMPLGASVTLKYLAPVFAAISAWLIIGERVYRKQWFYIIMALVGVFVLKGFESTITVIDFSLGITGAIFGGLVYAIIRMIGDTENSLIIVLYFMGSAAVLSGLIMIPFWVVPDFHEILLLAGLGVSGYFGQVFMTKGFQSEKTSVVAPIRYLEVVLAVIIGWVFFEESFSLMGILAIALIILSTILNVLVKK